MIKYKNCKYWGKGGDGSLDDGKQFAMSMEQFNKAIEPYIREIIKIVNLLPRTITVTGRNEVEFKTHWTPEAREAVKIINEIIEYNRTKYFET